MEGENKAENSGKNDETSNLKPREEAIVNSGSEEKAMEAVNDAPNLNGDAETKENGGESKEKPKETVTVERRSLRSADKELTVNIHTLDVKKNATQQENNEQIEAEDNETVEKPNRKKRKAHEMKNEDENANQEEKDTQSKDDSVEKQDVSMPEIQTLGKGKRARIPNKRYSDILLSPNRRKSIENASPEVEIKKEQIDVKDDTQDSLSRSSNESPSLQPSKKQKVSSIDVSDPKYLKPFKFGWRRELVWRSTSSDGKRIGDVYYFTPTGKKIRSSRELADNLKNKELTLENFTFFKESLGLEDPEKEIIRFAKVKNSSTPLTPPIRKPTTSTTTTTTTSAKKQTETRASTSKVESPLTVADNPAEDVAKIEADIAEIESPAPKPKPSRKSKESRRKDKGPLVNCKVCETPIYGNTFSIQCTSCTQWLHKKCCGLPNDAFNKVAAAIKKNGLRWVCHVCEDEVKTPTKKEKKSVKPENEETEVDTPPVKTTPTRKNVKIPTRASNSNSVTRSTKKRNLKLSSITNSNAEERNETKFMDNYLQNLSFGYNTLLYVFQYLKVQDLLRAGCVCTMWRDIASHPILWRTVRMKNSQVHSFEGLANTLKKHATVNLDLRKMLLLRDDIWPEFSASIERVDTLRKIELCRCPAVVVEQLAVTNPHLEVINAVTIKCDKMDLDPMRNLRNIKELRLKSTAGLTIPSIDSLRELKSLKHLSLTSINDLHKLNLDVIADLTNLESLDLGECMDFPVDFGEKILGKLEKLEKLRLEKGQGTCHTFEILEAVKQMKRLEQLELVNFDVKHGFDKALGACHNIKKLMIIPTYISQSATTNHMVLAGVLRLQGSLSHFVWGVTLELLRVTELFVDQCEEPKEKKEKKTTGNGDSIPVLKPVPDLTQSKVIQAASNPPQVEILPLPSLQKLLLNSLPTTRVKILKIPFHATWRQTLTDSV